MFVFLILGIVSVTITSELLIIIQNAGNMWFIVVFPLIACSSHIILLGSIKKPYSHVISVYSIFISLILATLITNELGLTYGLISGNFIRASPDSSEKLPVWFLLTVTESINTILQKSIELDYTILLIMFIITILIVIYVFLLDYINKSVQKDNELRIIYPWIAVITYLSSIIVFLPISDLKWSYWLLWIFGSVLLIIYEQKEESCYQLLDYWSFWGVIMFVSRPHNLAVITTALSIVFGFNEYLSIIVLLVLTVSFIFIWYYCFIKLQKEIKRTVFKEIFYIMGFFLFLRMFIYSYWQIIWIGLIILVYSIIFYKITLKTNFKETILDSWIKSTALLISILIAGMLL